MKRGVLLLAGTAFLLSACGGGGGSGDGGGPKDTSLAPKGIYSGTLTQDGETFGVTGIVPDGTTGYFYSAAGGGIVVAQLDADGAGLSGEFDGYVAINGSDDSLLAARFTSGSVTGNLLANSFTASLSASGGTAGTIDISKSPANSTPGTIAEIVGTWKVDDSSGITTITIDQTGKLTGSDGIGCQYSGQVTISPSATNAHKTSLSVACAGESTYILAGAVARGVAREGSNTLILIAADDDIALAAALLKQ